MYYCENCKNEFIEPKVEKTTYEEMCGVYGEFANHNELSLEFCPYCHSDDFEEMKACDKCGEYCPDEYLTDTEEMVGGGIGYLCPDCLRDCEV